MMNQRSKRELLEVVRPRCLQSDKCGKQTMLDEFTGATGYQRKYAMRLLKHGQPGKTNPKVAERSTRVKSFNPWCISRAGLHFTANPGLAFLIAGGKGVIAR